MSALLVDDLIVATPTRPQSAAAWRHVEREVQARPQLVALPGGRHARPRPAASGSWQLTDRGIAVVVGFFLALLTTAAVVLVTGFLSVSDAPLGAAGPSAPQVLAHS